MRAIESIEELEGLYDAVVPRSLTKVKKRITPLYRQWIEASRFVVLTTVGPEGTDGSPRGDDGPVVRVVDESTLWLPDWQGNNRMDSLRNIVQDGRVSLLFMVPGSDNVVRVNGRAVITAAEGVTSQFDRAGKRPRTVAVISVAEIYFQCAKALMRSGLWDVNAQRPAVPTAGQFLQEVEAEVDAASYDAGYAEYARDKMW